MTSRAARGRPRRTNKSLAKSHQSDVQLPEYSAGAKAQAAAETTPLVGGNGAMASVDEGAPAGAAGRQLGWFEDALSSPLFQ